MCLMLKIDDDNNYKLNNNNNNSPHFSFLIYFNRKI